LKLLQQNTWVLGKKGDFEFLSAMWNTILLLDAAMDDDTTNKIEENLNKKP